jgi:hypothetical protein
MKIQMTLNQFNALTLKEKFEIFNDLIEMGAIDFIEEAPVEEAPVKAAPVKVKFKVTSGAAGDDKIHHVLVNGEEVGNFTYIYGRSDRSEPWSPWHCTVTLNILDHALHMHTEKYFKMNYRDHVKSIKEFIKELYAGNLEANLDLPYLSKVEKDSYFEGSSVLHSDLAGWGKRKK